MPVFAMSRRRIEPLRFSPSKRPIELEKESTANVPPPSWAELDQFFQRLQEDRRFLEEQLSENTALQQQIKTLEKERDEWKDRAQAAEEKYAALQKAFRNAFPSFT